MPDDCYFPENDEKDDSDMEFDISNTHSSLMNTNSFSALANPSRVYNGDSSDEAPDDVTFETSKVDALQAIKDAFESVRQQKQKQKQKRQKKQEVLVEQKLKKKERLDELASKKLTDDVLHTIASIHQSENGTEMEQPTSEKETTVERVSLSTNHEENIQRKQAFQPSSTIKEKRKRQKQKRKQLCKPAGELAPKELLDFIPMNTKATEFHVCVLEKKVDNVVAKAVLLKDMKSKLIFGKLKRREPAWKAMAKLAKQEIAGLNNHHKMN